MLAKEVRGGKKYGKFDSFTSNSQPQYLVFIAMGNFQLGLCKRKDQSRPKEEVYITGTAKC